MPRLTGIQAAREIARRRPQLRILILSMHDNERYFFEALRAGAAGYVLKVAADRDLVEACRATMRGEPFLYPDAVTALIRDYLDRAREGDLPPEDPLTPRESEIVKLIAEGQSSKEIAELLVISDKTVERHRANILDKLGLRDRVDLTRYAIRRGLIEALTGMVGRRRARCGLPTIPPEPHSRHRVGMAIATWIVLGALVGVGAARFRPGRFPGGTLGAAITGAVGAFLGGGVFAALDDRSVNGLDLVTAVSAVVGATLMLTAMNKADHAEPHPD